jgi:hypothetical protein
MTLLGSSIIFTALFQSITCVRNDLSEFTTKLSPSFPARAAMDPEDEPVDTANEAGA